MPTWDEKYIISWELLDCSFSRCNACTSHLLYYYFINPPCSEGHTVNSILILCKYFRHNRYYNHFSTKAAFTTTLLKELSESLRISDCVTKNTERHVPKLKALGLLFWHLTTEKCAITEKMWHWTLVLEIGFGFRLKYV